jgi:hypothetical protein
MSALMPMILRPTKSTVKSRAGTEGFYRQTRSNRATRVENHLNRFVLPQTAVTCRSSQMQSVVTSGIRLHSTIHRPSQDQRHYDRKPKASRDDEA